MDLAKCMNLSFLLLCVLSVSPRNLVGTSCPQGFVAFCVMVQRSSALKAEAAGFSESLFSVYQITQRRFP
jgi:hypothetical protein